MEKIADLTKQVNYINWAASNKTLSIQIVLFRLR
jgi:hypothetical protein